MLGIHRRLGTWTRCVDAYIALTDLMRSKLISAGLPGERVHVKPNFVVSEPSFTDEDVTEDYSLFLGRLSTEKGIRSLIEAVPRLNGAPVKIVGTGPLEPAVRAACERLGSRIEFLGERPHAEAMEILRKARLLIFPSICYEGLPMTILEAMARGVPVVATRLGAMAGMIEHGREGLLFEPGDIDDLSRCVNAVASDDDLRGRMSRAARLAYEKRYSDERAHELLMNIYAAALRSVQAREQEGS
jgi:glycosyltransferase involved in cell wall biosynthesis